MERRETARRRAEGPRSPWRSAGPCIAAQLAWLVLTAAGQTLTLHLEEVLDGWGASPAIAAGALTGWVLFPIAAIGLLGLLALRSPRGSHTRQVTTAARLPVAALTLATLGCAAVFLSQRDYLLHRFGTVREGVLFRSAQMGEATLRGALTRHGVRTLVVLRNASDVRERERALAEEAGVHFVHIPMDDPGAGVSHFLEIMSDPSHHPVLAHCRHGVARTGVVSAVFRMEFDHWGAEEALAEARRYGGYDTLREGSRKRAFIPDYEPRLR